MFDEFMIAFGAAYTLGRGCVCVTAEAVAEMFNE